jgi:type VI secretion system secreted protein Hcp
MNAKFYVSIEGTKQGQFKGEIGGTVHKDKMLGIAFNFGITVPRDPATGLATGKRQYKPLVIIKEWGAASPQVLTALVTSENLKTVLLEFVRATVEGTEEVFHTIKLTNATIVDVQQYVTAPDKQSNTNVMELEEWYFTFGKIEVENIDGKTTFSDNWESNPG